MYTVEGAFRNYVKASTISLNTFKQNRKQSYAHNIYIRSNFVVIEMTGMSRAV